MAFAPDRRHPDLFPGSVLRTQKHEFWRLAYRGDRYLEHASETELMSRTRDIISNITELTYDGKIGLISPQPGGMYWMELFTHVLEELVLRGEGFQPGFMKDAAVPRPTFPIDPRAKSLLQQLGPGLANHLYVAKLGKTRYLEPAFKEGSWRISPASKYAASDPSLSLAQRDTELEMTIHLRGAKLNVWDGKTREFKGEIEPSGNIKVTSQLKTDYYVSCLTTKLDLRMFDDFNADCCIVVRNHREFAKRMFAAAKRALPSCYGVFRNVKYIDPFRPPKGDFDLFCSKDFRYSYQKEGRFAWILEHGASSINPLNLELGDISDIAQLAKL